MPGTDLIGRLLAMLKDREFGLANAAGEQLCGDCCKHKWDDAPMVTHHQGCPFVALIAEAELYLKENPCT